MASNTITLHFHLTAIAEGELSFEPTDDAREHVSGQLVAEMPHPDTVPTVDAILGDMRAAAFALESAAHLQGRERDFLPLADALRGHIAALSPRSITITPPPAAATVAPSNEVH